MAMGMTARCRTEHAVDESRLHQILIRRPVECAQEVQQEIVGRDVDALQAGACRRDGGMRVGPSSGHRKERSMRPAALGRQPRQGEVEVRRTRRRRGARRCQDSTTTRSGPCLPPQHHVVTGVRRTLPECGSPSPTVRAHLHPHFFHASVHVRPAGPPLPHGGQLRYRPWQVNVHRLAR